MPPLLVAGIIGLFYLLVPKTRGTRTTVVSTPFNSPIGINTGFATPPIASTSSGQSTSAPSNIPNAGVSGVPAWSAQNQSVNNGMVGNGASSFYGPNTSKYVQPLVAPISSQVASSSGRRGCSGGCGGCSGGCGSSPSNSCSTNANRVKDGGCMAPTQRGLLKNTNPSLIANWAANVASNPNTSRGQAIADLAMAQQSSNPAGEDVAPPVAMSLSGIGLTPPYGSIAKYTLQ